VAELGKNAPPADSGTKFGSVTMGANGVLTLETSHEGKTLVMRPTAAGNAIHWDCTEGTLEPKFRPYGCRPQSTTPQK